MRRADNDLGEGGVEGTRQNAQCFSDAGVLLNGFIFLNSFPKCNDRCQNKTHQRGHLQQATALKPVHCGRICLRGTGPLGRQLGCSLPGAFGSNSFISVFLPRVGLEPR